MVLVDVFAIAIICFRHRIASLWMWVGDVFTCSRGKNFAIAMAHMFFSRAHAHLFECCIRDAFSHDSHTKYHLNISLFPTVTRQMQLELCAPAAMAHIARRSWELIIHKKLFDNTHGIWCVTIAFSCIWFICSALTFHGVRCDQFTQTNAFLITSKEEVSKKLAANFSFSMLSISNKCGCWSFRLKSDVGDTDSSRNLPPQLSIMKSIFIPPR